MLQGAGYRTGYIGKWHLGTVMTTRDGKVQNEQNVDYTKPLKVGPPQYGFDDSFILPGSLDMYPYAFARNNVWQGEVTAQKGWSAFNRIGPAEKDFEDHEVLETFYREAESFIGKQKAGRPFFLYLALTAPHTPTSPGKEFQGKSELGVYGDFVMEVDHAVERVLSALKEEGLDENTLVLFSSDHGAASYAGNILKATPGQIRIAGEAGPLLQRSASRLQVLRVRGRLARAAHRPLAGRHSTRRRVRRAGGAERPDGHVRRTRRRQDRPARCARFHQFRQAAARPRIRWHRAGSRSCNPSVHSSCATAIGSCASAPAAGRSGGLAMNPHRKTPGEMRSSNSARPRYWSDLPQAPFVQLFNVAKDMHEDHNLAAKHPERVATDGRAATPAD